jgi:putative transposase
MSTSTQRCVARIDLYRDVDTDSIYRVAHADRVNGSVYLIKITGSRLTIRIHKNAEFTSLSHPGYRGEGRYVRVEDDPYSGAIQKRSITQGHVSQSEKNYELIRPLVDMRNRDARARFLAILKDRHDRAEIIGLHAKMSNTTPQRVRRVLLMFLQQGMTEASVASSYPNCGHKNDPAWANTDTKHAGVTESGRRSRYGVARAPDVKKKYSANPGPKTKLVDAPRLLPSVQADCLLQQLVDVLISAPRGEWRMDLPGAFFAEEMDDTAQVNGMRGKIGEKPKRQSRGPHRGRRSRPTLRNLSDHGNYLLRNIKEAEVCSEDGEIISLELAPRDALTPRKVQHYINTHLPWSVKRKIAVGPQSFYLNEAPFRGHALSHVRGPGDVYLIDATVADVYLVSSLNITRVVARPTIYFIVDVWSRMIAGIYVGFEYPSMEACSFALENMVMRKSEFCARFGLDNMPDEDWPCDILPNILHADRGKDFMVVEVWKRVNQQLHVEVDNCKAYCPTWRAIGERRWNIVPSIMQRNACGIVETDHRERGGRYYPWDAIYTLTTYTRMLIRAIDTYHQTPIGGDSGEPKMDKPNTPLERWRWGMANISGDAPSRRSVAEVRQITWKPEKARITQKGIECRNAFYNVPKEFSNVLYEGRGGPRETVVLCGPTMSQIIYQPYDTPITCELAPTNKIILDREDVDVLDFDRYRSEKALSDAQAVIDTTPRRIKNQLNSQRDTQRSLEASKKALKGEGLKHPVMADAEAVRATEADVQHARRRATPPKAEKPVADSDTSGSASRWNLGDAAARDAANKELQAAALDVMRHPKK